MRRNMVLLAVVVALLAFFAYVASMNKTYIWNETYSHTSDQPFGCQWFDSIAATTMPKGYRYYEGDFRRLMSTKGRKALMVINPRWHAWDSLSVASVDSFVRAGNKLMIVTDGLSLAHNDWLGLEERSLASFSTSELISTLKGKTPKDTLVWMGSDVLRVPFCRGFLTCYVDSMGRDYRITAAVTLRDERLNQLTNDDFAVDDDTAVRVRISQKTLPISVCRRMGKGQLYISLTPLFFTNYGALNPDISQYLNRQMSQLADLPVYRLDPDILHDNTTSGSGYLQMSPLRFMLSNTPLRWALYTILSAVVIFMLFTARRRQRVIPLLPQPVNRNLDFARLIGTIYCRRHDNTDLIKKKYTYFREEIRRTLMIDIDDHDQLERNVTSLAVQTSVSDGQIRHLLSEVREALSAEDPVSDKDTIRLVRQMSELTRRLQSFTPTH